MVTITAGACAVFPELSLAMAEIVCDPLAIDAVFS